MKEGGCGSLASGGGVQELGGVVQWGFKGGIE